MKEIVNKIVNTSEKGIVDILYSGRGVYSFLNPVSYLIARDNYCVYKNLDGIFSDGSLLVKFINFFYSKSINRCSFDMTSCAPVVFNFSLKENKRVFLIGSESDLIKISYQKIIQSYPSINIVGYRDGFFTNDAEILSSVLKIIDLKTDIVIVGMGAPRQEKFLLKLKENGYDRLAFTCGGFIHQLALGDANYYPALVNRLNIRFLYRMLKEPHTRKRYIIAGLKFPLYFLLDKFRH
ncbi:WecB/TagA/CpsF family glycosyltransferase [Klebsiella sp. RHBSTW-00215]|uniref:WecB/TagA/CpsF family glycosyltransferase n=1 Tax=Klebsiella sp. RHBSTW-00215 TaxID=2742640 RepID=UPI0015F5B36E|nr:WecB/TagA/CpsF family glycosyltransferase [Klebsiella sp. RHBSTW-00215]MBA7934708.1 WecB/TagA/CpsF family glycosyltransferase [Klebsiella sp. RHBSTW-00215]